MLSGQIIRAIIEEFDAPGFIYDLEGFRRRVEAFNKIFKTNITGYYACKSNPLSDFIKIAAKAGFGADVASLGELDQALRCGIDPGAVIVTGPAKSKKIFSRFIDRKVSRFVIESLNHLNWLNQCCMEQGTRAEVLLRVQLSWERDCHSVLGGHEISAFGLDPEQWRGLRISDYPHLDFHGFHFFQWGNVLEIGDLLQIWKSSAMVGLELARQLKIQPKTIDIGGGLGISYLNPAEEHDLALEDVIGAYLEFAQGCGFESVYIEPGRFLSGPYGVYCSRILDRKTVRGRELLILEGGSNHILRPMLTGQGFPAQAFSMNNDDQSPQELEEFYLHGPLCTALDKLGNLSLPKSTRPGDWLIFSQCGAYGFTESMPFFLAHPLPFEVVVEHGEWVCRRFPQPPDHWLV